MPRPAKVPAVTAAQARYILEKLIDEGKVTAADVRRHLGTMWAEMSFLERRINELRSMSGIVRHPVRETKDAVKKIRRRRKSREVTPERAASQRIQGQYLGYLRQFAKNARKAYQDIAKTKGREAAIDAMKAKLAR